MTNKTRNAVLSAMDMYDTIDSGTILFRLGKKNRSRSFDNSTMRFVRRLNEAGYLKRLSRGEYKVTAKGRRYATKTTA